MTTQSLQSKDQYLFYPKNPINARICMKSEDGRHLFRVPSINCEACGFGAVIVEDEVLYVPTEKGVEYHLRTEPNVLLYGGRGSAKSTTGRWDAHMRSLAQPGFRYVILRRTYPELDSSHLVFLNREMHLLGGSYNKTEHKAIYPNGSVGFFRHCNTEEDVQRLLGSEFSLAFFDELAYFEWEQFTKISASVRAPIGSGHLPIVRGATNPLGPSAMKLLEYFVDKSVDLAEDPEYNPNNWYAIQANIGDNPYLPKEEYMKRFSGIPSHIRKAWIEGEFSMENSLFDFSPTKDGKPWHVIHDLDLPKILKDATVYRSIDAGWYPDPTVVLWIAHLGNRHIIFNEKTWYRTTYQDIASDIKDEDARLGVHKVAMTYCDPSMNINTTADVRTLMESYESCGIPMEPSINNREYFALSMNQALTEEAYEGVPRLQIYKSGLEGCPMLVRTIPQMRYDPKQPKKMDDHKQDHWVVAACYYLMSHAADLHREGTPLPKLRPWMVEKKGTRFVLGSDQVRGT